MNKIGQKIKKLRKHWGLTLDGLATKTDSSKSFIWEVENKNTQPSAKKIVAIANALKTTPNFLLDDTKEDSDEEAWFFRKYKSLSLVDKKKLEQIMDILS